MRNSYQIPLLNVDRLIKLVEVERALAQVFYPALSRPTIIGLIEEGTLTGRQQGPGNNWFVYQSSLDNFILDTQAARQHKLAA